MGRPHPREPSIAVLPLRDIVVFPAHDRAAVRRPGEVRARARRSDEGRQADPAGRPEGRGRRRSGADDIYDVGTVATVLQLLKLPDGTVKVLVEGGQRARIAGFTDNAEFFEAVPSRWKSSAGCQPSRGAGRAVVEQFENYVKLNKKVPPEVLVSITQIDDPAELADTIAAISR